MDMPRGVAESLTFYTRVMEPQLWVLLRFFVEGKKIYFYSFRAPENKTAVFEHVDPALSCWQYFGDRMEGGPEDNTQLDNAIDRLSYRIEGEELLALLVELPAVTEGKVDARESYRPNCENADEIHQSGLLASHSESADDGHHRDNNSCRCYDLCLLNGAKRMGELAEGCDWTFHGSAMYESTP
jgi:hypothetical protein